MWLCFHQLRCNQSNKTTKKPTNFVKKEKLSDKVISSQTWILQRLKQLLISNYSAIGFSSFFQYFGIYF
jgi:hypothetical protein